MANKKQDNSKLNKILFFVIFMVCVIILLITIRNNQKMRARTDISLGDVEYNEVYENANVFIIILEQMRQDPFGPEIKVIYNDGTIVDGYTEYELIKTEEGTNIEKRKLMAHLREVGKVSKEDLEKLKKVLEEINFENLNEEYEKEIIGLPYREYVGFIVRHKRKEKNIAIVEKENIDKSKEITEEVSKMYNEIVDLINKIN